MKTKKFKIYIAGKVTGLDYDLTVRKFKAAADTINELDANYQAINPMDIVPENTPHEKAMELLRPHLLNSNVMVMLPDWVDSPGSRIEHVLATAYGIPDIQFGELKEIEWVISCLQQ